MSRVLEYIKSEPWAIQRPYLETIVAIAERELSDVAAIEKAMGERHEETRVARIRDGVGIVPVHGPIFRYANLFTRISGATSTETLANDIGTLLADSRVHAIVLDVDSPGGAVNGTNELAQLIFEARDTKPIFSHISGLGASAGYYIAAAATEVFAGNASLAGSIGTVLGLVDYSELDAKRGIRTMEFVSAQSPKKRLDPFSDDPEEADEAKAELQALVDGLAEVFIADVARFRGVSSETVLSDFGQGGVFVGAQAMEAGLVDGITTLETLVSTLSQNRRSVGRAGFRLAAELPVAPIADADTQEIEMSEPKEAPAADPQPAPAITKSHLEENHGDVAAELVAQGAAAERDRIAAIQALHGPDALKAECVADPNCSAGDAALKINAAQAAADSARAELHLEERAEAEDGIDAPAPSGDVETAGDAQKLVARALSLHNAMKGEQPTARA